MDGEILDRLLMDRALGGLSPDVEALLAAYLEQTPTAAARAGDYNAAADAARQVLRGDRPATLPPFPAIRLHQVAEARRRLRLVRQVAGLAAALVLGVGLGAGLFRGQAPSGGTVTPVGVDHQLAAADERPAAGDFWSAVRLYERARHMRQTSSARLIWDSAVSRPRVGGES